jgi:hypothetical protein
MVEGPFEAASAMCMYDGSGLGCSGFKASEEGVKTLGCHRFSRCFPPIELKGSRE